MRVRKSVRYRAEGDFNPVNQPAYKGGPIESLLRNQCKRVILEFEDGSAEAYEADRGRLTAVSRIRHLIDQDIKSRAHYLDRETVAEMQKIADKIHGAFAQ